MTGRALVRVGSRSAAVVALLVSLATAGVAASVPLRPADRITVLAGLAVVTALAVIAATRPRRRPPQQPDAAGQALAALAEPALDPRAAIVRCYAAMEAVLATVPGAAPRAADSPSEVLHRALAAQAVRSPDAWRLVELFDKARFSRHPITERDRQDAAESLRVILDELGAPSPATEDRLECL
jgi:hypothetical protein